MPLCLKTMAQLSSPSWKHICDSDRDWIKAVPRAKESLGASQSFSFPLLPESHLHNVALSEIEMSQHGGRQIEI